MERYANKPDQLLARWVGEDVTENHIDSGGVGFHYHAMEEWLEVLTGELTFFSAGNRTSHRLGKGDVLHLALGEVHRVEVGSEGATYRRWTPVAPGEQFRQELDEELRLLVERNLEVPEQENRWDSRDPSGAAPFEKRADFQFLRAFASDDLVFRNADGAFLTKEQYLARAPAKGVQRDSSGSVQLLHVRRDEPASVLLSTVVHVWQENGPRRSYENVRAFVRGPTGWACRLWLNVEEVRADAVHRRGAHVFEFLEGIHLGGEVHETSERLSGGSGEKVKGIGGKTLEGERSAATPNTAKSEAENLEIKAQETGRESTRTISNPIKKLYEQSSNQLQGGSQTTPKPKDQSRHKQLQEYPNK